MNIAVILAGGAGARLNSETPKQLMKVGGKTMIEYSLDVFEQHPLIDEIAVVVHQQYITDIETIVMYGGYQKVQIIIIGGEERHDSSWAAIKAYRNEPDANLLIHDAARPLIDAEIISKVIHALEKYNAVTVALPATDTIYQVENNIIQHIPDRKQIMRAQTPQAFKQHILQKAYQSAFKNKNFAHTDDCGVVVKYMPQEPIYVVLGSEKNLKITHPEDLYYLEKLLICTPNQKIICQ
jgi:2-C-methyl-D-erythritol 4-phosphate cytidylyltransferase